MSMRILILNAKVPADLVAALQADGHQVQGRTDGQDLAQLDRAELVILALPGDARAYVLLGWALRMRESERSAPVVVYAAGEPSPFMVALGATCLRTVAEVAALVGPGNDLAAMDVFRQLRAGLAEEPAAPTRVPSSERRVV
jgi:hypothetical protein